MNKNDNELNSTETKTPKSKSGSVFSVIAIVLGILGLVFYWYVSGLARGFSSH